MANWLKKLIPLFLNHPKKWIIFNILLAAVLIPGLNQIARVNTDRIWFRDNDPYLKEYDQFVKTFGNDDTLVVAIHRAKGLINRDFLPLIREIHDQLELVPEVVKVDSLANFQLVKGVEDEIQLSPLISKKNAKIKSIQSSLKEFAPELNRRFISIDRNTVLFHAKLKYYPDGASNYHPTVNDAKKRLTLLQKQYPGQWSYYLSGVATMAVSFDEVLNRDLQLILPLGFITLCLILGLFFRSIKAVGFGLITIVFSVFATSAVQGYAGIPISLVTSMIPMIIVAICLADSIHVLQSYQQFSKSNPSANPDSWLQQSLNKNIFPTLLTTITTVLGLGGLIISELAPVTHLGLLSSIGIFIGWYATMTIFVPLLRLFPAKANSLSHTIQNAQVNKSKVMAQFIFRFRKSIVLGFFLVALIGVALNTKNEINSNLLNYFEKDTTIRKSTEFLLGNFGGITGVDILIDSQKNDGIKDPIFLKKIKGYIKDLYHDSQITKVSSLIGPLERIHKVLHAHQKRPSILADNPQLIGQEIFLFNLSADPNQNLTSWYTQDFRKIRLNVLWSYRSSKEYLNAISVMEDKLKTHGLNGRVTGKASLLMGLDQYIIGTFIKSLIYSMFIMMACMMVIFRSLKIGLISMLPNIIPPLIGGGLLYLTGRPFDVGTVLVTTVTLGIAVDDTIYFLSNYMALKEKHPDIKSINLIEKIFKSSSMSLIKTTAILVLVFALFGLGSFAPNKNFGLLAATVLSFALVTDLVLLPGLLIGQKKGNKIL